MVHFWSIVLIIAMLLSQYLNSANTSDAEEESCKGYLSNKTTTDSSTVQGGMLFENFQSIFRPETSKEELSTCLERMHQNEKLDCSP